MVIWMEEAAHVVTDICKNINNSTVITTPLTPPSGVGDDDVHATLLLIRKYIYLFESVLNDRIAREKKYE